MATKLKITRIRSDIGRPERQRATMRHLGLRKMNDTVVREDSAPLRGMIEKVAHMVKVEQVEE